jgi:hypothetical protein
MAFMYTGAGVEVKHAAKLPPEGDYFVQIIAGEEKISSSGKDMIVLTCKIMHETYHNEIRDFIVAGDHAQQRIYDILMACGTPPAPGMAVGAQTFIGKRGKVRIKHESYDGDTYPRIRYWKTGSSTQEAAQPATDQAAPTQPELADEIPF